MMADDKQRLSENTKSFRNNIFAERMLQNAYME